MKGVVEFSGSEDLFVGKKSEFKTKELFVDEVKKWDDFESVDVTEVYDGWVRFYPKGTPDHPESCPNEPFYMCCEKAPGAFECWFIPSPEVAK